MLAVTAVLGTTAGGPPPGPRSEPQLERQTSPTEEGAQSRRIAISTLGRDLRFTLTAVRSRSEPLQATVHLRVFTFQNGVWRVSDRATVGDVDGWFWFPLTGRRAVCAFSTASTEPAPVAVRLLVTPSIGCSSTERFRVENGRIVPA